MVYLLHVIAERTAACADGLRCRRLGAFASLYWKHSAQSLTTWIGERGLAMLIAVSYHDSDQPKHLVYTSECLASWQYGAFHALAWSIVLQPDQHWPVVSLFGKGRENTNNSTSEWNCQWPSSGAFLEYEGFSMDTERSAGPACRLS